jgi:hypothetical protein
MEDEIQAAFRELIQTMNELNEKERCREYSIVITNLEQALLWYQKRQCES